ncbi:MAG: PhzF family phenazine biosynthesis protein [bacterium]
MRPLKIKQVNAFTTERFSGNPAGVVLDAKGLQDNTMQLIAREMNLSETAFILPPTIKSANLQIRWFTPNLEVALCGHATIASFHALSEESLFGMKHPGDYSFKLQTKSGVLTLNVRKHANGSEIEFQIPIPKFKALPSVPLPILKALGLSRNDVDRRIPFLSHSYLYLPLRKLSTVQRLQPEYGELERSLKKSGKEGLCVFTLQTIEESSAVHSRFFAPGFGILEDPVTGSANGPLGAILYSYAITKGLSIPCAIRDDRRLEFIGEQGDEIDRKGRVKIRVKVRGNTIEYLSIAGEAVTIFDAVMHY